MKEKFARAAVFVKQKSDLIVDNIELPLALEVGQVLVKIFVSGICGSQIGEINGVKGKDKFLPHLLGHEGCGEVLEIGPGVKTVNVGDRVCLHWRKGSGIQSDPPKYKWRGQVLNAGWITTFNNYAVISENRCTKVDSDISIDHVALFGCAVTTGFGVIENNAELKIGESLVVFGSGGVGLNIIQAAKLRSAWPIIAIDLYDNRLKLAKELGAHYCINSNYLNPKHEIEKILGKNKLDIFIDNTGIPEIIEMGYELTNSNGKVVLVGVPKVGNKTGIYTLPLHFGKKIIGSHGGESHPENDIPRYMNLLKNNFWNLNNFISKRYELEQINEAIQDMKNGSSAGRLIIDMKF